MNENKIIKIDAKDTMARSYAAFGAASNARAIPDARDGLKPVHRRILFTALSSCPASGRHRKSAALVGEVLGRFHPHSDTAVYDALVGLTRSWQLPITLLDQQGNFGSPDGSRAAAPRYTEIKLSSLSQKLLLDGVRRNAVSTQLNYNQEEEEPILLPAKLPFALINGVARGSIGVGYASCLPSHNPNEVIDACKFVIENLVEGKEPEIEDILIHLPGPDYPLGGVLDTNKDGQDFYKEGVGKFTFYSEAEIEDKKIILKNCHPEITTARLVDSIAKAIQGTADSPAQLPEITAVRDETTAKKGKIDIRVVIEVSNKCDPSLVLQKLYRYTLASGNVTYRAILLDENGVPKLYNIKDLIISWAEFRLSCIRRVASFQLNQSLDRLHVLEGIQLVPANVNKIIEIIKKSKNDEESIQGIKTLLKITTRQAKAIVELRLKQINQINVLQVKEEIEKLKGQVEHYKAIAGNESRAIQVLLEELEETRASVKSIERKTKLIGMNNNSSPIPSTRMLIVLTQDGYFYCSPTNSLKEQRRGTKGGYNGWKPKSGDSIKKIISCQNSDVILVFLNTGNVLKVEASELPTNTSVHTAQLGLSGDEKIEDIVPISSSSNKYLVLADSLGGIKRMEVNEIMSSSNRKLIAFSPRKDATLIQAELAAAEDYIVLCSARGKSIKFLSGEVRCTKRPASFMNGITLVDSDRLVSLSIAPEIKDNNFLLTITKNGFAKMTELGEFKSKKRGAMGSLIIKLRNGDKVISTQSINPQGQVVGYTKGGVNNLINLSEIANYKRYTAGTKFMNIKDGDCIVSIAVLPDMD